MDSFQIFGQEARCDLERISSFGCILIKCEFASKVTTRSMPRFDFYEPGFFCFALVLCIRAAHVKFASGWGVGGVWDIAFYGDALALIVGIGDGYGR